MTYTTRALIEGFLDALTRTNGAGGIADFRLDDSPGCVRIHVRHRLSNLFRPHRREGIAICLYENMEQDMVAGIALQVVASYVPLWMRRRLPGGYRRVLRNAPPPTRKAN